MIIIQNINTFKIIESFRIETNTQIEIICLSQSSNTILLADQNKEISIIDWSIKKQLAIQKTTSGPYNQIISSSDNKSHKQSENYIMAGKRGLVIVKYDKQSK